MTSDDFLRIELQQAEADPDGAVPGERLASVLR